MDGSQPLSMFTHRKTYRVRGPRPCSWISSSSDSSSNEHRDIWPWSIARTNLSRGSTLRSTVSTASSDSGISSPTSSPVRTPNTLVEYNDKSYGGHARRRKPAGPRAPRNSSYFDVRPGLLINTSLPTISQFQQDISPTTPVPVMPQSPQIPLFTINSPTNFILDWDAIFEMLGCSESLLNGTGSW